MLTNSVERINALAGINSASKYLEVGVWRGATFTQVNVPYKVAVDRRFQFDFHGYANDHTIFHEVVSDYFFTNLASQHGKFDLIFLDGLHTFEQTFRDFCVSLKFSHANTLWLIDDTVPSSLLAANPNDQVTERIRRLFHIKDYRWMGDVYKVIFAIHDFFPQFSWATFNGHGQTVIWLETRKNFTPTWNSLKKISLLGYRNFLEFKESHMSIMDDYKVLDLIKSAGNRL